MSLYSYNCIITIQAHGKGKQGINHATNQKSSAFPWRLSMFSAAGQSHEPLLKHENLEEEK